MIPVPTGYSVMDAWWEIQTFGELVPSDGLPPAPDDVQWAVVEVTTDREV